MATFKERLKGCGCLAILAVIVVCSLEGALVAWREHAPTKTTMAGYARDRPSAQWLEVSEVTLDLVNAVTLESAISGIKKVYIPLRPRDEEAKDQPAALVLATEDPAIIDVFRALKNADKDQKSVQALGEALASAEKIQTVSGLIHHNWLDRDEDEKAINKFGPEVVSNCPVLVHNEKPEYGFSIFMVIGGGIFAAFVLIGMFMPDKKGERPLRAGD